MPSRTLAPPHHRTVRTLIYATVFMMAAIQAIDAIASPQLPRIPSTPTPTDVVERMLRLAGVGRTDVVYDLGCGDGRIVIAAARLFGARGIGVDIVPQRIEEARLNAKQAGVDHLVTFKLEDALKTDVSEATVVTLYLVSALNIQLRPILTTQLRPGARIVSHNFGMGDWSPDKVDTFVGADGLMRTLYLWKVDGQQR